MTKFAKSLMADGVGMNYHEHGDMNMMGMHSSFYWGKDAIILFSGWPNKSLGMYILAVFGVFLLAVIIELLSASLAAIRTERNPMVAGFRLAVVHGFRMGLAYLVMLSLMSFNLGILIAALVGHAVGFFIFKAGSLALQVNEEESYE
ncbi:hypothetical protein FNV43_RR09758 [Rhamnella rubrinervis]|uniref:Copper transport protein n=1 Tax=Rhamnella rubrinervis TaxID=2594499 RepID=A0A8K0HBB2_9ROSA|nr:hypothetical protein FNV43_RR09758 [Rhamnella rubrinervis]